MLSKDTQASKCSQSLPIMGEVVRSTGEGLLIFGGTTEGRLAVEVCEQAGKPYYYSTTSSLQSVSMLHGQRLTGAMDAGQMKDFCQEHGVRCIIDAAHPFAENLHRTIAELGLPIIRLQRSFGEEIEGVEYCDDFADALAKLQACPARKLLALSGANTIAKLHDYWTQHPTIFRVLNRPESMKVVDKNGLPHDHIIYYKEREEYFGEKGIADPLQPGQVDAVTGSTCPAGLPTEEDEKNLMQQVGCDAIITKESGETGGFDAKVQAALSLGLRVLVVRHPRLPSDWTYVNGRHSLRRAIEHLLPDFFPLKTGLTTGACATAATKAALLNVLTGEESEEIAFALPDGEVMSIPVASVVSEGQHSARATVKKDFSDDPDVTRGCMISSSVELLDTNEIEFRQGEGVGVVTLPGLGIPVGEPAINPTPRAMITNEIRQLTDRGVAVTISVENGRELAKRTFNPKVGVVDGISIIGTSGIVSPLSNEAFIQSICRELEVAKAIGCKEIAIVGGKKAEEYLKTPHPPKGGEKNTAQPSPPSCESMRSDPNDSLRCIHYGNFVGETLKAAHRMGFERVIVGIMIGKAVKLAEGHLDTHSHKVQMNKQFLKQIVDSLDLSAPTLDDITMARELWNIMPPEFFDEIVRLCYKHCRTVFPTGELSICLIPNS